MGALFAIILMTVGGLYMSDKKKRNQIKMGGKKDLMHFKKEVDPETGEILGEKIEISWNKDIHRVSVTTKDQHKDYLEHKKRQEYMVMGRRAEQFVQTTSLYEKDIAGKYPAKKMECLMKLIPYMNYNGNRELNAMDVIRIHNKPAILKDIAKLWGVHRETASRYLFEFVEDGILEPIEVKGVNGNTYKFKSTFILKGTNLQDNFTKKIILKRFQEVIKRCDEEVKKELKKEKRRKSPRFDSLHPLALLGGLLTKTHYKTFFLLRNHEDPNLVKEGESVTKALNMVTRRRKFKFINKKEMWFLYTGQEISGNMNTKELAELKACIDILIRASAMGEWRSGKNNFLLMNPTLVYVSPNMKFDPEWSSVIQTLFNLGDWELEIEEE